LLGVSEVRVGAGLTVNDEDAVFVAGYTALSVTEAVMVVAQLPVSALLGMNIILSVPSALKVLDVELREPQVGLEVVYDNANEGVPPDTVAVRGSCWFASRVLLEGESEIASAGLTVMVGVVVV
jgi:hypothetical protein